jgi:hypothetical protein
MHQKCQPMQTNVLTLDTQNGWVKKPAVVPYCLQGGRMLTVELGVTKIHWALTKMPGIVVDIALKQMNGILSSKYLN